MSAFSLYSTSGEFLLFNVPGDSHENALQRALTDATYTPEFQQRLERMATGTGVVAVRGGGYDGFGTGYAKLVRAEKIERPTYRTFVVES